MILPVVYDPESQDSQHQMTPTTHTDTYIYN